MHVSHCAVKERVSTGEHVNEGAWTSTAVEENFAIKTGIYSKFICEDISGELQTKIFA